MSQPWPISVSPVWNWREPSWFSTMRQEELSKEMGHTAVLYQNTASPTPRRTGPVWSLYSSNFFR